MLRFGHSSKGPLADARAAAQWLGTLPVNEPLAAAKQVVAALGTLTDRNARRTPAGLGAVFIVDTHTSGVVRALTAQYALHASRSPKIEDQFWRALFDLSQAYQACLSAFAREVSDRVQQNKWQVLMPELIARQIVHLARDAKLRLYRCERWIPAKWAELHALFSRACTHGIERHPLLLDPSAGATTIEHQYLMAMVLQLVDPGDLKPKQIEWVATYLHEWCRPLRLTLQARSPSTFYVNIGGTSGLRRRTAGALEGRVLFVDTQPLHAQLVQNRIALEQALKGSPASARTHEQREQLELFIKLASRVDPEFRPLARRGERKPASGQVDAIVGFASIAGFLNDERSATDLQARERSFGNTMDLALFGRARNEPARRDERMRRRIAEFASSGGPWELKDTSASGFRLHASMTVASELTLSMLVAVHRDGLDGWVLGIVRRMRRLSGTQAEIGLQIIANGLERAELMLLPPEGDDGGETVEPRSAAPRRRFEGLLLSYEKGPGDPVVQSLLVPPVEYRPTRNYSLTTPAGVRAVRFGRLLEQQADWVWTVIEPAPAGTPATDAASPA